MVTRRIAPLTAAPALTALPALALALLAGGLAASAAPAGPAAADTMCDGVTVIVDFTDLGGEAETGCGEGDPASGREALESAGFAPVDSSPGLICTIDSEPDPCPEAFDGNYWAYWIFTDGEWAQSQVGADEADPVPGAIEGWRYNDGATPPPLPEAVPTASESASAATEESATTEGSGESATSAGSEETTAAVTAEAESSSGVSPVIWIVVAVAILAAATALILRRRKGGSTTE